MIFNFCILNSACFAAFNLTATPSDGGFDLRLGRVSPSDFKVSKEISIRVSSDIGKQYRVSQRIVTALATEAGAQLPDEQFKMYALVNSNSKGTLVYREEIPVSQSDTVLYTSDGTGDSDVFKLVYTITPSEAQASGSYFGRISYILLPIDSTESQVVVSVNVYVELVAGNNPVVEITAENGLKRLSLSSKGMTLKSEIVPENYPKISIKIPAQLGASYKIYQSLEGAEVISGTGEKFDLSKVLVSVDGAGKGAVPAEVIFEVAKSRQLLYTSDQNGSVDEFIVSYKPSKDFRLQKTDFYKGRLSFILETEDGASFKTGIIETYDVEFDIVALFDIYVTSKEEEGVSLKFGTVGYKTGPKTSESEIFVDTNMGKPYQIIQKVSGPMSNENSDKVPVEDFTVKVKEVEAREDAKFCLKDETVVKEGDTVVYDSGPGGEGAHLIVEYKLVMRPDSRAGNYSTKIGYSLSLN